MTVVPLLTEVVMYLPPLPRRDFLQWSGQGLLSAALASLWQRDGLVSAAPVPGEATNPPPHFPAKAKRVIHIYACGGVSQIDSFDYKPELQRQHGQTLNSSERPDVFFGKVGLLHKPMFEFKQRGQSGRLSQSVHDWCHY